MDPPLLIATPTGQASCKPGAVTPTATLHEAYVQHAGGDQEALLSKVAFGKALSERGFGCKHINHGKARTGITLRPDSDGVQ